MGFVFTWAALSAKAVCLELFIFPRGLPEREEIIHQGLWSMDSISSSCCQRLVKLCSSIAESRKGKLRFKGYIALCYTIYEVLIQTAWRTGAGFWM